MSRRLSLRSGVIAAFTIAASVLGPVSPASADGESEAHGTTAVEVAPGEAPAFAQAPLPGWDVPEPRSYHLDASCEPHADAIREGAAAWNDLTEGGGTPVECRTDYISDCGGGTNVVGCNWGQGQRIALYMGGVNDDALLAAHEFGHNWYGHSGYECAGWGSPEEAMAPTICNAPGARGKQIVID